jgi:DNA repair protein RecO (recombination protein O)
MIGGASTFITGFVLHRRAYQESSFLVDILSLEAGKIRCVARGMRSAKSDRKSVLQPFQPIACELTGKSELKSVKNAENTDKSIPLQHTSLFCGMYLNELINRVLPSNIPCPDIVNDYYETLKQLNTSQKFNSTLQPYQEAQLRCFELNLLAELGYLPDLSCEVRTQTAIEDDMDYVFISDQGLFLKQWYPHLTSVKGQWINDVLAQRWHPESLRTAKWITRQAFQPLLGDKPLKSRELFVSK